jgi:hypothetical protein
MSPQEYYPQRGVVGRHEETFNDVLYAQLRKTPWWLISGAIHLVLIIGLWNFTFSASNTEEEGSIMANQSAEDFDDLKEEPPPVEEIPPIEQEEEPIEDPTIKDTPVEQEDTDEEFEETQTDQDLLSDAPFDGPSTNSTIGIGGGAGGAFGGRGGRRNLRAEGGGGTQGAVDLGLEWLKNHQSPEGYWDCDNFMNNNVMGGSSADGPGYALFDPGISGLALLAFLGAGETHKTGRYRKTVRMGLRYPEADPGPGGLLRSPDHEPLHLQPRGGGARHGRGLRAHG